MNNGIKRNIKCVVWDLDETIWEGVLSENDNLTLRPGIKGIIEILDNRGILNSIASRNNADEALVKLKSFSMREYFVYPQISWNAKSEAIRNIKEKLNIAYNTIAFIDDQEYELAEVRSMHPEVCCYGVSEIEGLLKMDEFSPALRTEEAQNRRLLYQADEKRSNEELMFENNVDFLFSLKMKLSIKSATVDDLKRVEELTLRTNQLNATGYTFSYQELESLMNSKDNKIFVVELEDKFGSYGKVGVTLLKITSSAIIIKLLLISCRVISRGIGNILISRIINLGLSENKKILAEFLPTASNKLMYLTYKFSNFKELEELQGNGTLLEYRGPADSLIPFPPYMDVIT